MTRAEALVANIGAQYGPWTLRSGVLTHPGGCMIIPSQVSRISDALDVAYQHDVCAWHLVHLARAIEEYRVGLTGVAEAHWAAVEKAMEDDSEGE